jgi:N,N'-diacetyllegionaminate synthase
MSTIDSDDGGDANTPGVCVIAEIGSVHDGSFGNARQLIETASDVGADVAKFQTHLAEAETLRGAPMPPYFKGEPRFEYFQRTAFTIEQWMELKAYCDSAGIEFVSSPFSLEAVDLLERVGVSRYKVGSGEVTNTPMIEEIARTRKPVVLSSGMSSWEELDAAVEAILKHHDRLTLLQCTSAYPCPYEEVGLNVMLELRERYRLPVGLSDHTLTTYAPVVAVALGAVMIEKHLTFSRRMYGSDARHSLEPEEFRDMVAGIRAAEVMMRSAVDKDLVAVRLHDMKEVFEKSIVAAVDIEAGATLTPSMLAVKKPGTGIPARRLGELIGRTTSRAIRKDTLLSEDSLHA